MKRRRIKVFLFLSLVPLLLGSLVIIMVREDCSYARVKDAITRTEAERLVDENKQYFLIATKEGGTGIDFSIIYGEYANTDVVLTGASPRSFLSNVFFLSKQNTFLVMGDEYNISSRGIPFSADSPNNYSINVVSWEIVIPVRRDYQYRSKDQKERLFAPTKYLDQFDVDQGDYIKNNYD